MPFRLDARVVGFNLIAHVSALSDGLLDADTLPLMLLVKTPMVQDWNIQWLMWWWSIEATWSPPPWDSVHDARIYVLEPRCTREQMLYNNFGGAEVVLARQVQASGLTTRNPADQGGLVRQI